MFNQPMSSPMMKTMFGFFPDLPPSSRSATNRSPPRGFAAAGTAAEANGGANRAEAASQPARAPSSSAAGIASFDFQDMRLLHGQKGPSSGRSSPDDRLRGER